MDIWRLQIVMKVKAYLNNKMVGIFVICATILIFPMFLQTLERLVGLWERE